MQKIKVNTSSKKYKIVIGKNIFHDELNKYVHKHKYQNIYLIVDENVYKHYENKFALLKFKYDTFINQAGEKAKSFTNLQKILEFLLVNKANRKSLVISIGGGVTGDVGGFAASIFMRGLDVIQIPTTLLSMVDSSVGGKTGINFKSVKNVIGSFYQPVRVIIDLDFIKTVPKQEIYSGFGEIYKSSLLSTREFNNFVIHNYTKIVNLDYDYLVKAIYNSVMIKKDIVEKDEYELTGERKLLNLGHTFGHALESAEKFNIPHGICVMVGILFILYVAKLENQIKIEDWEYQSNFLKNIFREIEINQLNNKKYNSLMLKDKKNTKNDVIKFVLFKNFSDIELNFEINAEKLKNYLKKFIDFFNNYYLN